MQGSRVLVVNGSPVFAKCHIFQQRSEALAYPGGCGHSGYGRGQPDEMSFFQPSNGVKPGTKPESKPDWKLVGSTTSEHSITDDDNL